MRGWDGIWETSFGRLRLVEKRGARVQGFYECGGPSQIDGVARGDSLGFRYREPNVSGTGHLQLAEGGRAFTGEWRPRGESKWSPWSGRRIEAQPGIRAVIGRACTATLL